MVFLSPMRNERCTPASIAPYSQCFEGMLLVFDSDYSGVCILTADDHLLGMLPARKQLYFLGHLQNHNWWYCARLNPTVMFSCWLCIWLFAEHLESGGSVQKSCSLMSLEVLVLIESSWNHIPERRSPTCCSSRTLTYLKACLLQISFAWPWMNLPLCAQFCRY